MPSMAGPSHTHSGRFLGRYQGDKLHMAFTPSSQAELLLLHHNRQLHKHWAAGVHLMPSCWWRLKKHIQFKKQDMLWVWLEFGMKTNLRYIHHSPQSHAGFVTSGQERGLVSPGAARGDTSQITSQLHLPEFIRNHQVLLGDKSQLQTSPWRMFPPHWAEEPRPLLAIPHVRKSRSTAAANHSRSLQHLHVWHLFSL